MCLEGERKLKTILRLSEKAVSSIGTLFVFVEGERNFIFHSQFSIFNYPKAVSSTIITRNPAITKCARMRMLTEMCLGNQPRPTTYSIAPAAADSSHGMNGVSADAHSTTSTPKIGSTMPDEP